MNGAVALVDKVTNVEIYKNLFVLNIIYFIRMMSYAWWGIESEWMMECEKVSKLWANIELEWKKEGEKNNVTQFDFLFLETEASLETEALFLP